MKSIIDHLALATQILGSPVAPEALNAQVTRHSQQRIHYSSLIEILKNYGFENSLSKRALLDIPALSAPVVVFLQDEEAAVITKIEGRGEQRRYVLRQTDGLSKVLSQQELAQIYFGYCWFIKPKVEADIRSELPEYHLPKAWFWKVIWRFKPYYAQVILATFLINFLALVSSLYVMNVYDRVIPNKSYETLWVLSIGVVLAITFEFIAKLIRSHLTDIAGKKADLIISSAIFRRVMAIKMIDKPVSSGSYANNLRDFESVREFMTSASLLALVDFPFLLLFLFVIYMLGGSLVFVPMTLIPLVILVGFLVQPKIARYMNESMREASQRQGLAVEAIDGIESLKANNAVSWAQQRWDRYTAKTAASQIKIKDLSGFVVNFSVAIQQLNTVFLVLVGTYLIHSNNEAERITMGALIATVILSGRALAPLAQIASLATRFQQARIALRGLNQIIERPIERDPTQNYVRLNHVEGQLAFHNVAFQYQKEGKMVLSSLNLMIRSGEKVGIIGRIGSGKSTLLTLASGLYQPTQGHVTLDNVDLRQIDPNYLRNQLALLSQTPHLFLGTLRENMEMACQDSFVSDQKLLAALNRFGLLRMVQHHPRGLEMPIGANGQGLSGGQKQLVALARLTLREPKVVLLDEPTHSLDQGSENIVLQALAQWLANRTLVVVTHRPQVLQLVDRIIVIENGEITMDGKKEEILARLNAKETPPTVAKTMSDTQQTNTVS